MVICLRIDGDSLYHLELFIIVYPISINSIPIQIQMVSFKFSCSHVWKYRSSPAGTHYRLKMRFVSMYISISCIFDLQGGASATSYVCCLLSQLHTIFSWLVVLEHVFHSVGNIGNNHHPNWQWVDLRTGNHRFSHEIWDFRELFPLNQAIETDKVIFFRGVGVPPTSSDQWLYHQAALMQSVACGWNESCVQTVRVKSRAHSDVLFQMI